MALSMERYRIIMNQTNDITFEAVSYTHLDVYKRQLYVICPICRGRTFVQEQCEECGGRLMIQCHNKRCQALQFFQNQKCTVCGKKLKASSGRS